MFTINTEINTNENRQDRYRLQRDNKWRKITRNNKLDPRDFVIPKNEKEKVFELVSREGVMILDGEAFYANYAFNYEEDINYNENELKTITCPYAGYHRLKRPKKLERKDLEKEILSANDKVPNTIGITLDGKFRIIPNPNNLNFIDELNYSVLYEIDFPINKNKFGKDARKNKEHKRFFERLFLVSINAWKEHLIHKATPLILYEEDLDAHVLSEKEVFNAIDFIFKDYSS